jgi:hypothetical protein
MLEGIDDEQVVLAGGEACFELGDDLGGGLDAGAATKHDDDVAELAMIAMCAGAHPQLAHRG